MKTQVFKILILSVAVVISSGCSDQGFRAIDQSSVKAEARKIESPLTPTAPRGQRNVISVSEQGRRANAEVNGAAIDIQFDNLFVRGNFSAPQRPIAIKFDLSRQNRVTTYEMSGQFLESGIAYLDIRSPNNPQSRQFRAIARCLEECTRVVVDIHFRSETREFSVQFESALNGETFNRARNSSQGEETTEGSADQSNSVEEDIPNVVGQYPSIARPPGFFDGILPLINDGELATAPFVDRQSGLPLPPQPSTGQRPASPAAGTTPSTPAAPGAPAVPVVPAPPIAPTAAPAAAQPGGVQSSAQTEAQANLAVAAARALEAAQRHAEAEARAQAAASRAQAAEAEARQRIAALEAQELREQEAHARARTGSLSQNRNHMIAADQLRQVLRLEAAAQSAAAAAARATQALSEQNEIVAYIEESLRVQTPGSNQARMRQQEYAGARARANQLAQDAREKETQARTQQATASTARANLPQTQLAGSTNGATTAAELTEVQRRNQEEIRQIREREARAHAEAVAARAAAETQAAEERRLRAEEARLAQLASQEAAAPQPAAAAQPNVDPQTPPSTPTVPDATPANPAPQSAGLQTPQSLLTGFLRQVWNAGCRDESVARDYPLFPCLNLGANYRGKAMQSYGMNSYTTRAGVVVPARVGYIRDATELKKDNEDFQFASPNTNKNFGSGISVLFLETIGREVRQGELAMTLTAGDLSARQGGKIEPHKSHQNGLDTDIYTIKNPNGSFNPEKNWELIKIIFKYGLVHRIYTDDSNRRELCKVAQNLGELSSHRSILQRLEHVVNHRSHFHIRLECTLHNMQECRDDRALLNVDGCEKYNIR